MHVSNEILTLVLFPSHTAPEYLHHLVHGPIRPILRVIHLTGLVNLALAIVEGNLAQELPLTLAHREVKPLPDRGADKDGDVSLPLELHHHLCGGFSTRVDEHVRGKS